MPANPYVQKGGPVPTLPRLYEAFRRGFYGLGRDLLNETPHPAERRMYQAGARRARAEPDLFDQKGDCDVTKPHYWMGPPPTNCDVSKKPIVDVFIDGATTLGAWGFLLPEVHARVGRGLGTGRGQKYEKQADGRWLKTEG